jgi:hypothetical protein
MTTSIRSRVAALAAVAGMSVITLVALAPTASASNGGRQVIKSGSCTGATDWKLKVKTDDGKLESEYEVDSNRAGQVWAYKVLDNGVVLRSGYARTTAPSGSFEIKKLSGNRAGLDHFVARAHNLKTGERCTGALTF